MNIEEIEKRLDLLQNDIEELKKKKSVNKRFRGKFYTPFNNVKNKLIEACSCNSSVTKEIYCLDSNFINIIEERLTKEEIELYYKI